MKKIIILTQKVDENDDHRGFFIDWLKEFGKNFDEVSVITVAKGSYSLPFNIHVYSLGKDRGVNKLTQAVTFYWSLLRLIPGSSGIFAHASPIFVIASWPVAFLFRKKIILWYLHRSVTLRLKVAEKLCYKIVTATKESLKFKSNKIVETGHGINIDKFKTDRDWNNNSRLKILSVGRISKIKNYETLIEATKILKEKGVDFELKIIGQPVMPKDHEYLGFLKSLIANYQLQDRVHLLGFVPYDKIIQYYKDSSMAIGLTPDGGIDKAMLEGMASGCIVLTSNNAARKYLDPYENQLIFDYLNSNDLADKIETLSKLPLEDKKKISDFLVESVSRFHKLDNLISQIYLLL